MSTRKPYPSDVSDDEWAFVVPYLTLMNENAPQRDYPLREVFNALRWLVRTGSPWRYLPNDLPPWRYLPNDLPPWRYLPNDLPPWPTVYQQTKRWIKAGCFESIVHDLRQLLRKAAGRAEQPTAVILDARTMQSTPESGARA